MQPLRTIEDIPVYWDGTKLFWTGHARVDADGSPRAYGPDNTGLDYTANAGHPGNWYGVVTDNGKRSGTPIVQGPDDPYPGLWVSTTSYEDTRFGVKDYRRYLDAEKVPYVVIPGILRRLLPGVVLGAQAEVTNIRTGQCVRGVVGDCGPDGEIGEFSIAMLGALGVNNGARKGGTDDKIIQVEIWPGVAAKVLGEKYRLIPA